MMYYDSPNKEQKIELLIVTIFKKFNVPMTMNEVIFNIHKQYDNISLYPKFLIRQNVLRMTAEGKITLGEYRIMSLRLLH